MDPEQFARQVFGLPPKEAGRLSVLDGVMAAAPRPCVRCGELTDLVAFDEETLRPAPAVCEECEASLGDVPVELVG